LDLRLFNYSSELNIIGVDEAGRGPLAGAVVAAAVILPGRFQIEGLTDSKKLSEKKRNALYQQITEHCHWSVGEASSIEIDELNILQATMLAMRRAIINLEKDYLAHYESTSYKVLVDGNCCPDVPNCKPIIKGDLTVPVISAASIIAKVSRDRQMQDFDTRYPEYGFAKHKGYGTKEHLLALSKYGALEGVHRYSFAPVRDIN
jgi:ribonuclease HII|tara:strand:+ start:6172 stop:6783 length:612 start_codon:yes stop_codon:yes gene_type:complete